MQYFLQLYTAAEALVRLIGFSYHFAASSFYVADFQLVPLTLQQALVPHLHEGLDPILEFAEGSPSDRMEGGVMSRIETKPAFIINIHTIKTNQFGSIIS